MSRYSNKKIFKNQDDAYSQILEERQVPYIRHYATPTMSVPNVAQRAALTRLNHIWSVGDKFYKLAIKHYGTPEYWWVIALYNQTPTEASIRIGDVIIIPQPLDRVLRSLRG